MKLSSLIENASNTGNAKKMYEGIKQAISPNVKKIAPLKSKTGEIITDGKKEMKRCVKNYLEMYSVIYSEYSVRRSSQQHSVNAYHGRT